MELLNFLKRLVFFSFFGVVFYCLCVFLSGHLLPGWLRPNLTTKKAHIGYTWSRIKEARQLEGGVDVLIIGPSYAYRGVDTRLFKAQGIEAFNLGTSSQSPLQTEVLLERYLDNISPKKIIYILSSDSFFNDGVESGIDILSNDKIDYSALKMATLTNSLKVWNTYILMLERDILHLNNYDYQETFDKNGEKYISGGFVESLPVEIGSDLTSFEKTEWLDKQLNSFKRIKGKLSEQNIDVYFVVPPFLNSYYTSVPHFQKISTPLELDKHFIDFNNFNTFENTHYFADANHLNYNGAQIFSSELIELVKMAEE